jgi:hypothetical protein
MSGERNSGTQDTGPLVRPYALTGGRTRPVVPGLDMISTVVALCPASELRGPPPEQAAIVEVCQRAISVAEISAHLDLPLSVVKVLVSDLVADGAVVARDPVPVAELPETNLLQAVLDGIRRL